jgi:hypothetical protein
MPICVILDTFPSFLTVWHETQGSSVNVQIDAWLERYMSLYPELLQKQLDDYASLNEDWRVTAKERIFPALPERIPAMQTAHDNLLKVCKDVYELCRRATGFDNDLVQPFVIMFRVFLPICQQCKSSGSALAKGSRTL